MAIYDPLRQLARSARNRFSSHGLSPLARRVMVDGLTYLSPAKLRRIEAALKSVEQVPGDFIEFGVALGGSGILIASQSEHRRFHGFDVFGMIPEPASEKDDEKSRRRFQLIRAGGSRGIGGELYYGYRKDLLSEVKDSFARHGLIVGRNGIHLHQGLFEESWPGTGVEAIALAHIDCDWYDPVGFCLKAVAPKLSPGGVIIIDDFHDYGGCRTAVEEFLSQHSRFVLDDGPNPFLRLPQ